MYQGAKGALCSSWLWIQAGQWGVLRQNSNCSPGCPQGTVFSRTPAYLQACHQAGPQVDPDRRVCGCPQGGLHQVQNQPKEGQEASCQEMVLRAFRGIWSCLSLAE